jgi:hypothetical protein
MQAFAIREYSLALVLSLSLSRSFSLSLSRARSPLSLALVLSLSLALVLSLSVSLRRRMLERARGGMVERFVRRGLGACPFSCNALVRVACERQHHGRARARASLPNLSATLRDVPSSLTYTPACRSALALLAAQPRPASPSRSRGCLGFAALQALRWRGDDHFP